MTSYKYNEVCDTMRGLEKSKQFIDDTDVLFKFEKKLKKVYKLLNDEYRFGSSYYDLKCLSKYIKDLESLTKLNVTLD